MVDKFSAGAAGRCFRPFAKDDEKLRGSISKTCRCFSEDAHRLYPLKKKLKSGWPGDF